MKSAAALCPSARCKRGALLLGVVGADGAVGVTGEDFVVDDDFVRIAGAGRTPEKRFRFADACARSGCSHWTEGACGLIDVVLNRTPIKAPSPALKPCAIRTRCRWYFQRGADACAACAFVITDLML
jgi:hypothetical protein